LLFFLLPSGVLLFLYSNMAVALRSSIRKNSFVSGMHGGHAVNGEPASSCVHNDRTLNSSRRQIIRMLGERGEDES